MLKSREQLKTECLRSFIQQFQKDLANRQNPFLETKTYQPIFEQALRLVGEEQAQSMFELAAPAAEQRISIEHPIAPLPSLRLGRARR